MKTSLALKFFISTIITQAVCGTATVSPASTAEQIGSSVEFECVTTASTPAFTWDDVSTSPSVPVYLNGNINPNVPKYSNFQVDVSGSTSTLTISSIELEDEGSYQCDDGNFNVDVGAVTVEVGSIRTLTVSTPCIADSSCTAKCDAVGGRPQETIQWTLNGVTQTSGVVESNPTDPVNPGLTNTRSVFTFTRELPDEQTLQCLIGGHAVSVLNGNVSETLSVQYAPASDAIDVTFDRNSLDVTCIVITQPNPSISNFWIYQNTELIHESTSSESTVRLTAQPENGTEFMCVAGNYLGNATASEVYIQEKGPSIGGIVGGVCAALAAIIVVIGVSCYVTKKKQSGSSHNDPNCSNKVSTEKTAPKAAPRKIEHTTDNPGGDEYAMVSKPPARGSGGEYVDGGQNGKGQQEAPMHYADLDLSTGAGHTEQRVPKKDNDVVVYSSILV